MKRLTALFLSLTLLLAMLAACTSSASENPQPEGDTPAAEKLNVVATIFPQYDFIRAIAGDAVDLTMLLSPGSESHSYDPTPKDIIEIQESDMFIYVGGDSDEWINDILSSMDTSGMNIVSLMDIVEVVEEEIVEGMEEEHGHSHGTSDFEDGEVQDRTLSDWAGDWQSVYPYLLDGTLDPVMEGKAEASETMSAADYTDYYTTGYATETERIVIDAEANTFEFFTNGVSVKAEYAYQGYEILTYESGNKGVRYLFEAVGETNGAPRYLQFSDHEIGPSDVEHFHLYWGDESFDALLEEMDHWPTYYPSAYSAQDILDDQLGHDSHDDEEEAEYDEHVWTSPVNAMAIVQELCDVLSELDPDNAALYQENTAAYLEKLAALDAAFREVVENGNRDVLIFADRFPLLYFVDTYGLRYYAAFPGCSTETEPSAATVAFLIDKVEEEHIPVVFYIEMSNQKMADTIIETTDAQKMLFHSCHNVTAEEFAAGATYLDLMEQNVEALREALK